MSELRKLKELAVAAMADVNKKYRAVADADERPAWEELEKAIWKLDQRVSDVMTYGEPLERELGLGWER